MAPTGERNGSQRRPAASRAGGPQGGGKTASERQGETPAGTSAPEAGSGPPELAPGAVADANELAIPGYDTLAASQVVQRLSSLRQDELDAIRAYELSTRGRRTILHRISQLTGGMSPASPALG